MTAKMSQERKRGGGKVDENPGGRLVSKRRYFTCLLLA
jgi:hypothetical protein